MNHSYWCKITKHLVHLATHEQGLKLINRFGEIEKDLSCRIWDEDISSFIGHYIFVLQIFFFYRRKSQAEETAEKLEECKQERDAGMHQIGI